MICCGCCGCGVQREVFMENADGKGDGMGVGCRSDEKRDVKQVFVLRRTENGKSEVHVVRVHLDAAFLQECPGYVYLFDRDGECGAQGAMQSDAACFC